jgi:hypothetical protein
MAGRHGLARGGDHSDGCRGRQPITGRDGKQLGLVSDVLVDADRRPRAAVIDFGSFPGVGSRKVAIDWRLLKSFPATSGWKITLI